MERNREELLALLALGEKICSARAKASNENMGQFKGDYDDEYINTAIAAMKIFEELGWKSPKNQTVILKDDDGHKYKIPKNLEAEFKDLLDKCCSAPMFSDERYDFEDEFIEKFNQYMC